MQHARRLRLHRPQRVRGHDAPRRRDARGGEGALQGVASASARRSRSMLGGPPDIVFEHVGKATFPTSVLAVKPFGKVVICGATSGYTLDFDVRYLWMRQKQIIGSHFANAWECNRANELIEQGKIRPVLWQTLPLRGRGRGAPAHARQQAPGQDRDPRRRRRRGPGQDRRGPGRDPGGGGCLMAGVVAHPVVRDALPRRQVRGGAAGDRAGRAALRRDASTPSTARATTATSSTSSRGSRTSTTSSATGTARSSATGARTTRAGTRCRWSTPGTTW